MKPVVQTRPPAVVAFGGNALLPSGGPMTIAAQRERATIAAPALGQLCSFARMA
jgi:carbamate kinase